MRFMPVMVLGHDYREKLSSFRASGFPFIVTQIPWPLLELHEPQARQNHGQSFAVLASRGGLSASEALAIMEDRRFERMDEPEAHAALFWKVFPWTALHFHKSTSTRCHAVQHSDQVLCDACSLAWDANDPAPPACPLILL